MKVKSKVVADREANVAVIDFGEKIDEIIRNATRKEVAKMEGSKKAAPSQSRLASGYRPGTYTPFSRSSLGASDWKLGAFLKLPEDVKRVGRGLLTGGVLGTIGNRVVNWVAPRALASLGATTSSKMATEAIGFGLGIIPYIAKPNATTVGIALPGLFFLLGSLTEYGLEKTNILGPKPALSGPQLHGHLSPQDAAQAARRKLAEVQARMQQSRQSIQVPRVVAQPQRVAV